jgi:hypothetical protein
LVPCVREFTRRRAAFLFLGAGETQDIRWLTSRKPACHYNFHLNGSCFSRGKLRTIASLNITRRTRRRPHLQKGDPMFRKVATLAGVALCLSLPAVAQQTTQSSSSDTTPAIGTPTPGMSASSIRHHLMQDLEKAGYTDVKIVPASFVAEAKDKQGHPVTMLINPDSVTTITMVPESSASMGSGSTSASNAHGSGTSTASNK